VVLALGRESHHETQIALGWSAGCGSERTLHLQTFRYSPSGLAELSSPEAVLEAPGLNDTPSLLFEPEGFAVEGATGGWSLVWVESSPSEGRALWLARFSEDELTLSARVTLRTGAVGTPIVYLGDGGTLRYALIHLDSGGRAVLETVGGWCNVRH
jgi:hypothetical protein